MCIRFRVVVVAVVVVVEVDVDLCSGMRVSSARTWRSSYVVLVVDVVDVVELEGT